ncbi:Calpain-type cysteine protease ADL1 [Diplonema papillatum]|nr:Calpain-type cysteine protease ADL1 [Diplonema papillatum]
MSAAGEVECLRRENALLREVNAGLEEEARLAREGHAASQEQARLLLSLVDRYAAALRRQSEDDRGLLEEARRSTNGVSAAGRPFGTPRAHSTAAAAYTATPGPQPPHTPATHLDTSTTSAFPTSTHGPCTPVTAQTLVHESPPKAAAHPLGASTSRHPRCLAPAAAAAAAAADGPAKRFPVKKRRLALASGDAWAPKGTKFDPDLVVGVAMPAPLRARFDRGAAAVEPMLLGGGVYKVHGDLAPGEAELSFFNGTTDTQFTLDYTFSEGSRVRPGCADVSVQGDGRCLSLTVYPGDWKVLAVGYLNGYSMNLRYGFASANCLALWQPALDERVAAASAKVRALCLAAKPRIAGSEAVADLCAQRAAAFVDPDFPPGRSSLVGVFEGEGMCQRPWIRMRDSPAAAAAAACEESNGIWVSLAAVSVEPTDIDAGLLGDSWLTSAFAAVAEDPITVESVFASVYGLPGGCAVTQDQDRAAGVHRPRVCLRGWWVTVVVDEWVPASPLGPAFARSLTSARTLWPSMLQKCFAKVHGSYAALRGEGDVLHALADLTGAGAVYFNWKEPSDAWPQLAMAVRDGYIVVLSTPTTAAGDDDETLEATYATYGLSTGHSYRVVSVLDEHNPATGTACVLRNPWGDPSKWTGRSDASAGTITVPWPDACSLFDCGGVCYYKPNQQVSVRAQVQFAPDAGPNVMAVLTVRREVSVVITVHQEDPRGSSNGLAAYCTSIVTECGGEYVQVAASHAGTFWKGRETVLQAQLPAQPQPYYVVPRAYQDDASAEVTLSFLFEGPAAAGSDLSFVRPPRVCLEAMYFDPIYGFNPSRAEPAEPLVQIGRGEPFQTHTVSVSEAAKQTQY